MLTQKIENWESEKIEEDMESYDWNRSRSREAFLSLAKWSNRGDYAESGGTNGDANDESVVIAETRFAENDVDAYKDAVSELFNKGSYASASELVSPTTAICRTATRRQVRFSFIRYRLFFFQEKL